MTEAINKKYEFTGETKEFYGRTLKQIRRLKDGAIGGWIELEDCLSHDGDCWVERDSTVFRYCRILGDTLAHSGVFHRGVFHGGEFWGGVFHGGVFWGGEFHGGEFWGGVFHGGVFKNVFDYLFISGHRYSITLRNDGFMSIGCQTKSFQEWLGVTASDARDIDNVQVAEFETLRSLIEPVVRMFANYHEISLVEPTATVIAEKDIPSDTM